MGNASVTIKRRTVEGSKKVVFFDLALAASYATNGDTLLAADIQTLLEQRVGAEDLTKVDLFIAEIATADGTEYALDRANKKVKAFNGRAEVANATNLSAAVARCKIEYGGSPGDLV